MKLITKINLNFLSAALLIFFVGSVGFYMMLRYIMVKHVDEQLVVLHHRIRMPLDSLVNFRGRVYFHDDIVLTAPSNLRVSGRHRYNDTIIQLSDGTMAHYRKMEYVSSVGQQNFRVQLFKPLQFADELIVQLTFALSGIVLFFLLAFFYLNRYASMQGLEDFFSTIQAIRVFKTSDAHPAKLPDTDVDEFEELNSVLRQMMTQIRHDFVNLKEFTENASHEIQTPLAIITSNVEQLIQSKGLTELHLKHALAVQEAAMRLAKLNKGLLLLARIDNRQFVGGEPVSLSKLLAHQLEVLSELIEEKQLQLSLDCSVPFVPTMHEYLAELLVFNLLKNAVVHNVPGGVLRINSSSRHIEIQNSGVAEALDTEKVFERFAKGKQSKSMGLGLAIVKRISLLYDFELHYTFHNGLHSIRISSSRH